MKNLKKILACLMTATMVAGLSAISVSAAPTRVEGEAGELAGTAAIVTDGLGADVSGGAWVGSLGADAGSTDTTLTLTVKADAAGKYTLTVAYNSAQNRSVEVAVNGGDAVAVTTPASGSSWTEGIATATVEVELKEGDNTLVLFNSTGWAPNIDYVEVEAVADDGETTPPADDNGDDGETTPPANDNGGKSNNEGKQEQPGENEDNTTPPQTGDAALVAVAVAVVAMAGVAVVSKKRNTAE